MVCTTAKVLEATTRSIVLALVASVANKRLLNMIIINNTAPNKNKKPCTFNAVRCVTYRVCEDVPAGHTLLCPCTKDFSGRDSVASLPQQLMVKLEW